MAAFISEEAPAPGRRRGRKPKSANQRRKLLKNEKVEVRSIEEGFLGSWHSGTVSLCKNGVRRVQYDYLLTDDGCKILIDHVQVSPAIDGLGSTLGTVAAPNDHRNFIRPPPPPLEFTKSSIHYGQCVDLLYEDAWWEGVIFDREEGSDERAVFFPDMGDELKGKMENLRITQIWDEVNGKWDPRGDWIFLDLIEEIEREWPVLVSLKQIWYEVRVKKGFENLKDWTSSARDAWKKLILEVVFDAFKVTTVEFVKDMNSSWDVSLVELDGANLDDSSNPKLQNDYPLEVVSFEAAAILPVEEETNQDVRDTGFDLNIPVTPVEEETNQDVPDGKLDRDISMVSIVPNQKEVVQSPALLIVPSSPDELSMISEVGSNTRIKMNRDKCTTFPVYPESCNYLYVPSPHVDQPNSQITSLVIDQPAECHVVPINPSVDNHMVIEAENCPQALVDFVSFKKSNNTKREGDKYEEVKLKALSHLCAAGWIIYYYMSDKKEMHYRSPSDKIYKSLLRACKACIRDEERAKMHVDDNPMPENKPAERLEFNEVKAKKIRRCRRRNKRTSSALVKATHDLNGVGSTSVIRSGKRARQAIIPSPSNNTPRTVLCWLIEKNIVLPRAKVYYQGQREGRILGDGRVTREGIKCNCCQGIFNFREFEHHLGSTVKKPTANLFFEDGKSLLECQLQLKREFCRRDFKVKCGERKGNQNHKNDHICSVCHYGGELVLCDQCPSSFHTHCIGLEEVPEGDWYCSYCCCKICGKGGFTKDTELFTDNSGLNCHQCEKQYHVGCLKRTDQLKCNSYYDGSWFCNKRCEQIFTGLFKLLGKPIPLGVNNLTWTLLKHDQSENYDRNCPNIEELAEGFIKLHIALDVMHECFEPVKEPRTKRDLVEDVIFGRRWDLHRLNFQGFYIVLLERNEEVITAATLRIYGEKVAEVPLVATRFQYRRLGMCRILMNELEKRLTELGVERLVLPAVPSVLHTWTTSFGFSQMTESERLSFLGYTFLDFQGTSMCQKLLTKTPSNRNLENVESVVPVVYEADEFEENRVSDSQDIVEIDGTNGNSNTEALVFAVDQPLDHVQCQSEITTKCKAAATDRPHKEGETNRHGGNLKCYKRRKVGRRENAILN